MSGTFDPRSTEDVFASLFGGASAPPKGRTSEGRQLTERQELGMQLMDFAAEGYVLAERWGQIAEARR